MADIIIEGLDELLAKLGKSLRPYIQRASQAIAKEIENKISKYPEPGPWNMPAGPGSHWYKRGYGGRYMTVAGEIHDYGTSQDLGKSWAVEPMGTTGARLTNSATYAPYVHSAADQVPWHKAHGWIIDEDAIKKVIDSGVISDIMLDAIYHGIGWQGP